jgi:hypothetical protein
MKLFHKKLYRKRVALDINARAKERIAQDIERQTEKKDTEDFLKNEATKIRIKELAKEFTFKIPEN